ncbi:MAG: glycosyltransferase family 4 protein [Rhizobacter sp.]
MTVNSRSTWLFVDAIPHFGGHEVMLLRWLEELLNDPHVLPRLLARDGGRLFESAPARTRVTPFQAERNSGSLRALRNLWHAWRALRRTLQDEQPECVVFASGALGYQMVLVALARLHGARVLVYVPLLDTFASMGYRFGAIKDVFVRWFYGRVPHGWVTISAGQAAHFVAWARPSGPVFVLPNAVARSIETAGRLVPRELNHPDRLRVLVLGRLDAHQKGLDLLVDHLQSAKPEVQDRLVVCVTGEGPYRESIEARLRGDPALARCLELGAWMPAQQAMAANDVLLLPSRFEGVPLVMLEAMALGLPVVASDLPGIRAYVPRECLFDVGDLARALQILQWLADAGVRQRLADSGRAVFEATASGRAFSESVSALTRDIAAHFGQSPCHLPINEARR